MHALFNYMHDFTSYSAVFGSHKQASHRQSAWLSFHFCLPDTLYNMSTSATIGHLACSDPEACDLDVSTCNSRSALSIARAFSRIDTDGDGRVARRDLIAALRTNATVRQFLSLCGPRVRRAANINATPRAVLDLFSAVDTDDTRVWTLPKFQAFFEPRYAGPDSALHLAPPRHFSLMACGYTAGFGAPPRLAASSNSAPSAGALARDSNISSNSNVSAIDNDINSNNNSSGNAADISMPDPGVAAQTCPFARCTDAEPRCWRADSLRCCDALHGPDAAALSAACAPLFVFPHADAARGAALFAPAPAPAAAAAAAAAPVLAAGVAACCPVHAATTGELPLPIVFCRHTEAWLRAGLRLDGPSTADPDPDSDSHSDGGGDRDDGARVQALTEAGAEAETEAEALDPPFVAPEPSQLALLRGYSMPYPAPYPMLDDDDDDGSGSNVMGDGDDDNGDGDDNTDDDDNDKDDNDDNDEGTGGRRPQIKRSNSSSKPRSARTRTRAPRQPKSETAAASGVTGCYAATITGPLLDWTAVAAYFAAISVPDNAAPAPKSAPAVSESAATAQGLSLALPGELHQQPRSQTQATPRPAVVVRPRLPRTSDDSQSGDDDGGDRSGDEEPFSPSCFLSPPPPASAAAAAAAAAGATGSASGSASGFGPAFRFAPSPVSSVSGAVSVTAAAAGAAAPSLVSPALPLALVVNLTELHSLHDAARLRAAAGLGYAWCPVPDYRPPSLAQCHWLAALAALCRRAGAAVAFHCAAGRGRTGVALAAAAALAAHLEGRPAGLRAGAAVAAVRAQRPLSVETEAQERVVDAYARLLARCGRRRDAALRRALRREGADQDSGAASLAAASVPCRCGLPAQLHCTATAAAFAAAAAADVRAATAESALAGASAAASVSPAAGGVKMEASPIC